MSDRIRAILAGSPPTNGDRAMRRGRAAVGRSLGPG